MLLNTFKCVLSFGMKRSRSAQKIGISSRTALHWSHDGAIKGYRAPSGTVIVVEDDPVKAIQERIAMDARVSSHEHRENGGRRSKKRRTDPRMARNRRRETSR